MKNKKQILIMIIVSFGLLCFFSYVHTVSADASSTITYTPQIKGITGDKLTFDNTTKTLANYIKDIYNYGVGIAAIVATIVLMIGGFQWLTSGGSGEKVGEALSWIKAALSGLVLVLGSYMILDLVNPNLVNFKISTIKPISPIETGCCLVTPDTNPTASDTNRADCEKLKGNFIKGSIANNSKNGCTSASDKCWGTELYSTLGGVNTYLSNTECPNKCGTKGVDYVNSRWTGTHNDVYCCICKSPDASSPAAIAEDKFNRTYLAASGITVNHGKCAGGATTGCTNLDGMPTPAIELMVAIKNGCDSEEKTNCFVRVSGGTEPGHMTHGPGRPNFDLSNDKKLLQYFQKNVDLRGGTMQINKYYTSKDGSYRVMYESFPSTGMIDHFHVEKLR